MEGDFFNTVEKSGIREDDDIKTCKRPPKSGKRETDTRELQCVNTKKNGRKVIKQFPATVCLLDQQSRRRQRRI